MTKKELEFKVKNLENKVKLTEALKLELINEKKLSLIRWKLLSKYKKAYEAVAELEVSLRPDK